MNKLQREILKMMFRQAALEKLDQYFAPLADRPGKCVFFYRFAGISAEVSAFIKKYYEAARKRGAVIDGRIPNPTSSQLGYLSEMLGMDFRLDQAFLAAKLGRWLPRISVPQREALSEAIFATLQELRRSGKNDNMLKNAYVKYMCWLYYKFEHVVSRLGEQELPKILYNGAISNYELQLLAVLARVGADVALLEPAGDAGYAKADPESAYSRLYQGMGLEPFPADFSLKQIQQEISRERSRQRLYGRLPSVQACTNAWLSKPELKEVLTSVKSRGEDGQFFYNCFIAQYGVADKLAFANGLFDLYRCLKGNGRRVCVNSGAIPLPTPEEIAAIRRKPYTELEHLAGDLAQNIQDPDPELQRLLVKAFLDLVLAEGDKPGVTLPRLNSAAVYLLCWLKRYQKQLFGGWRLPEVGVFIQFGGCGSEHEARFLRFLAKLPVDVLVLQPNLNISSCLQAPELLELRFTESLTLESFPTEAAQVRVRTAAYQAERDLDSIMYQDTGMYRNHQYAKAESVTLKAMYEEIALLWDQELKYRTGFQTSGEGVTMPVLLEKICGVKDGRVEQYWQAIKGLLTPDTLLIPKVPWLERDGANPWRAQATQVLQNGRLLKNKIKSHKDYAYGILRAEMQDHLLDKLQLLLEQRLIAGTYQNGTEYTIVAVALNLPKELLRLIQRFDFTKKNPKLIVINTRETVLSLEDSILFAFMNLVGFDILFFVPTGYQCIEQHFRQAFANEQQIGEYLYDLTPPDFNNLRPERRRRGGPLRRLFGR